MFGDALTLPTLWTSIFAPTIADAFNALPCSPEPNIQSPSIWNPSHKKGHIWSRKPLAVLDWGFLFIFFRFAVQLHWNFPAAISISVSKLTPWWEPAGSCVGHNEIWPRFRCLTRELKESSFVNFFSISISSFFSADSFVIYCIIAGIFVLGFREKNIFPHLTSRRRIEEYEECMPVERISFFSSPLLPSN